MIHLSLFRSDNSYLSIQEIYLPPNVPVKLFMSQHLEHILKSFFGSCNYYPQSTAPSHMIPFPIQRCYGHLTLSISITRRKFALTCRQHIWLKQLGMTQDYNLMFPASSMNFLWSLLEALIHGSVLSSCHVNLDVCIIWMGEHIFWLFWQREKILVVRSTNEWRSQLSFQWLCEPFTRSIITHLGSTWWYILQLFLRNHLVPAQTSSHSKLHIRCSIVYCHLSFLLFLYIFLLGLICFLLFW